MVLGNLGVALKPLHVGGAGSIPGLAQLLGSLFALLRISGGVQELAQMLPL